MMPPTSGPLTKALKFRLPQALRAELERLADETGQSKSSYARQAIIEFLERVRRERGGDG